MDLLLVWYYGTTGCGLEELVVDDDGLVVEEEHGHTYAFESAFITSDVGKEE